MLLLLLGVLCVLLCPSGRAFHFTPSPPGWGRGRTRTTKVLRAESGFGGDGGGVRLPSGSETEEYAAFLSEAVRNHLDEEWLPQECHDRIGKEVAQIYSRSVRDGGAVHVTDIIMAVGNELQGFEGMGDAFVGAWDVVSTIMSWPPLQLIANFEPDLLLAPQANLCSDFLFQRMGLETAGCCTPLPEGMDGRSAGAAVAVGLTASLPEVLSLCKYLSNEFDRYRWLSHVLEEEVGWREISIIAAVARGLAKGIDANSSLVAPHLERDGEALQRMLAEIPDTLDVQDGLDDFVVVLYGKEATRHEIDSKNAQFMHRSHVVKYLYYTDFLKSFPP
jgi:hypothetical protein